jgi:hypothetical protein
MATKERFCFYCGKSLGFIEDRNYDRRDSCGSRECMHEEREAFIEEREEAHRDLDERMGW